MTRIFGMAALGMMVFSGAALAEPGVLVEADSDTVMHIKYLGYSTSNNPILMVTGGKYYGGIVEGSWRGLTGRTPGYALPYPGLPAGLAGAGPIGVAAYASGSGYHTIGAHIMSKPSNPDATNYGAEVRAHGGSNTYGLNVEAIGGQNVYGLSVTAYGSETQNWAGFFWGNVYTSGTYEGSDRMFKKNIEDYSGGLAKVMALKPKSYDMKADEFNKEMSLSKGRKIGLIAQDLQEVLPELVKDVEGPPKLTDEELKAGVKKDGLKFKAVNYTGLIPVLIAAIQEQQARIDALEARQK